MRDLLLHLECHPDATSHEAVARAVSFAAWLGAGLTALACEVEFPVRRTVLSDLMIDVKALAERERQRCRDHIHDLMGHFTEETAAVDIARHQIVRRCLTTEVQDVVVAHARICDLAILPLAPSDSWEHWLVEAVIFGSGRPVLVLPESPPDRLPKPEAPPPRRLVPERIGVAWDASRPAARAVADALPLLRRAGSVKLLTIVGDKAMTPWISTPDLVRHLARHGIDAVAEERPAAGRPAADVLDEFARDQKLDLLVMGAYGHSRLREFVLGGATMGLLRRPPAPILLSH